MSFSYLLGEVREILLRPTSLRERLQEICDILSQEVPHYNWVGFYFADREKRELHLGPFSGAPTEHIKIPFGKGICGQVAESNRNFVVPDVRAQQNYIACSLTVKSEIVIPLFFEGENIGQIDIDSHSLDPFTSEDERFLEQVNAMISECLVSRYSEIIDFI